MQLNFSLDHILISDVVFADLFIHSLSGVILLYLVIPLYTAVYEIITCKVSCSAEQYTGCVVIYYNIVFWYHLIFVTL